MSTNDFKKGMEAGAKPFEEKFNKQAYAVERVGDNVNENVDGIKRVQDSMLSDLSAIEKKRLYDLNTVIDIVKMDKTEKEFLVAILYTLASGEEGSTTHQKSFVRSVKKYLDIKNIQSNINLSSIENIESINDQKAILQCIMEYLFLGYSSHAYEIDYEDLFLYFSVNKHAIQEIKYAIDNIFQATGLDGVAEHYGYVAEVVNNIATETDDNNESQDVSVISQICADSVNVNTCVETDDFVVYCWVGELFKVDKKSGEKTLIKKDNHIHDVDDKIKFKAKGNIVYFVSESNHQRDLCAFNVETMEEITLLRSDSITFISGFEIAGNKIVYSVSKQWFDTNGEGKVCTVDLKTSDIDVLISLFGTGPLMVNRWKISEGELFYSTDEKAFIWKYNLIEKRHDVICNLEEIKKLHSYFFNYEMNIYNNRLFFTPKNISSERNVAYVLNLQANAKEFAEIPITYNYVSSDSGKSFDYENCKFHKGNLFIVQNNSELPLYKYDLINNKKVIMCYNCGQVSYDKGNLFKKAHTWYRIANFQVVGEWLYHKSLFKEEIYRVNINEPMKVEQVNS